jgi:integrase
MAIKDIKPVKVNFNLRNITNKENLTAVHCIIRYNNERIVVSSVESVKPKYWDKVSQRAKATRVYPEYLELNQHIDDVEVLIKTLYRNYVKDHKRYPPPTDFKDLVRLELSDQTSTINTPITLFAFIQNFIDDTKIGRRINPTTKKAFSTNSYKAYHTTFKALERFEQYSKKNLTFDSIDLQFYNEFKDYMMDVEKVSNNYFGHHIKNIKLFMNESLEKDYHTNQKYKSKSFIKLQNDSDNIYLDKAQLTSLERLDLSCKARLDRIRDLFLVGCWTGLRFSDFNNINAKHIQGEFLEIVTQKTGEVVIIPIHSTIKNIMYKYKDLTQNALPPPISNVKMNKYLKELGEHAGFDEIHQIREYKGGKITILNKPTYSLISTHTARRSFATNMYLLGVPSITIMGITGHRTEKAFLKYIKVTPKEHAIKLREIWNRTTMQAV